MANTRTQIQRLHARRPTLTGTEIANKLGVSRQRVHRLAHLMGIELPRAQRAQRPVGECAICHRGLRYPGTSTHATCHYVNVKCAGCGMRFRMTRAARSRSNKVYHSPQCFQASRVA